MRLIKKRRQAEHPSVIREMDADALPGLAMRARANGIGLLLIDTPGKAETLALAACELADLVLVPTRPTQFDLETLGTVKRAERIDRTFVILSQCTTNSRRLVEQGEEANAGYGLPLAPARFYTRADFSHAMTTGDTAVEFDPSGKAAAEAAALFAWIRSHLSLTVPESA